MLFIINKDSVVMCIVVYIVLECFERGVKLFFYSDMYSLVMVMIEFSLFNCLILWDEEVVNLDFI